MQHLRFSRGEVSRRDLPGCNTV